MEQYQDETKKMNELEKCKLCGNFSNFIFACLNCKEIICTNCYLRQLNSFDKCILCQRIQKYIENFEKRKNPSFLETEKNESEIKDSIKYITPPVYNNTLLPDIDKMSKNINDLKRKLKAYQENQNLNKLKYYSKESLILKYPL